MGAVNADKDRMVWVDWMKIIGMYCIIIGHIFPVGYQYIYVFSVPVFFFISGFLSYRVDCQILFWKKLWHNLIVPLIFFSIFNFLWMQIPNILNGTFSWKNMILLPINILIGNQGENFGGVGLVAMWFVYTLCILKVIIQYVPQKFESVIFTIILLLSVSGVIELNNASIYLFNSWANVLIAFPFFYLGYSLRGLRSILNNNRIGVPHFFKICVSIVAIAFCGSNNEVVYMYKNSYGGSFLLFIVGSLAGVSAIYVVSKCLQRIDGVVVRILGGGTIVILGLHNCIIWILSVFGFLHLNCVLDFLLGVLILLAFIPANLLIKKYLPFLYGSFRK